MTKEQILQKAIEKASGEKINNLKIEFCGTCKSEYVRFIKGDKGYQEFRVNICSLIYSRDFAKAFFGEENMTWYEELQFMVVEEDPITYLEKFL